MLAAVINGMHTVKLCFNKIFQFLTGGGMLVDLYNVHKWLLVVTVVTVEFYSVVSLGQLDIFNVHLLHSC